MSVAKWFFVLSAFNGLLAVALGAFGAHALKAKLTAAMLGVWQTAVQYQFYHLLALLLVALLLHQGWRSVWLVASGWAFVAGLVLFCGSLYLLALGGPRWLGPITPLGGLTFMIGWLCLLVAALKL